MGEYMLLHLWHETLGAAASEEFDDTVFGALLV